MSEPLADGRRSECATLPDRLHGNAPPLELSCFSNHQPLVLMARVPDVLGDDIGCASWPAGRTLVSKQLVQLV